MKANKCVFYKAFGSKRGPGNYQCRLLGELNQLPSIYFWTAALEWDAMGLGRS